MENSSKTQLRRLIDMAHERQLAQIDALSAAERAESGAPERWSAKDHLAHTMFWKQRLAERLAAAARGETATFGDGDVQSINEANFEAHRHRPWADVLADDARIHAKLLASLDALAEDDLIDPARFPWNNGNPLLANVLGNLWHVQEHLAQPLLERGDLDGATQVFETFTRAVTTSDLPPVARAYALYNLAGFYVMTERPARALALLREGLRLHPGLAEWLKQDPGFASLRADPAYQALYAG